MNTTTDSDGWMVKAAPMIEVDLLEFFIDNQDSDSHNSEKYVSSLNFGENGGRECCTLESDARIMLTVSTN